MPSYYSATQENPPPLRLSDIFPKWLGIFNQFFTHLLYVCFYTRLQIFIQLVPTLTRLCHLPCATTQRIFLHFTRTLNFYVCLLSK